MAARGDARPASRIGSLRSAAWFGMLAAVASVASVIAPAHADGIEQLRRFVAGTHSARAAFEQTVTTSQARVPRSASGSMAFLRPGKFRWVYEAPYYQLIVGDGEKLWIYDRELNQVTVRRLGDALGKSPAALLAGDDALERNFTLGDAGRSGGLEWIEATPKHADTGFERVRIGLRDAVPRVMELRDDFGQTTLLRFSRFERNPALDPAGFRFVAPAGADVIGE